MKGLPGGRRFHSLQARLLWGTVLLLFLVMVVVTAVVEGRQREAIIGEVVRRGEALAQHLAAMSYGPLLVYNFTALEQSVARVASEADIVYAIVIDGEGRVAAHSEEPERVGLLVESPGGAGAAPADGPGIHQRAAWYSGTAIFDFAAPVLVQGKTWGTVRVGLSRQRMEAEIQKTRRELWTLAAGILLVGGVAAALFARRIANPVRQLEERAAAIARGELAQRIEPRTFDEIGRLAAAFNHMAGQLGQQRTALERVNAELQGRLVELEDVRSYTDSIVNSLTSGIVTVDLEGRIVTLNPVAELLTGFFRGEAARRYCTELFADTPVLAEVLMETLTSRAPIASVPLTLRRRNGALLPVELSTAPLKGGDGKDLGAVAVFRDMTAVRQLETRLRRTDRLAAVGTLAAGFAHEIKNPLTSLLTFSRRLTRRFDDPHFRERFQNVVPRELERINDIVERLLELARPPRLRLDLVRLPGLVDRVIELYANQIEAGSIQVVRTYARDVPPIQGDEEALYRAVVNLVANALEAMPTGGRLTVRLGWDDGDLRPPRGQAFNRRVRLEVEDTGRGVAPADAERIFNPFFTTRDRGTGLGLALTNKIIEDHGGAVDFRPAPGGGAIFRMSLPLVPEPPAEAAEEVHA